jgi:hypothetical protein
MQPNFFASKRTQLSPNLRKTEVVRAKEKLAAAAASAGADGPAKPKLAPKKKGGEGDAAGAAEEKVLFPTLSFLALLR